MNKAQKNKILYPDNKNGIYMYEYPEINGVKQYIQIRGADRKNPLILFIHGGPGGVMSGICHVMQEGWEDRFTVVNWDQRNAGKTYFANKGMAGEIAKTGSMADFVKDVDDIIAYLHNVYEFKKIIIMGFSWGTAIGAEYAKSRPENVLCCISVGQLVNYHDGVLTICKKILEKVPKDSKDEQRIKAIMDGFPDVPLWTPEFQKRMRFFNPIALKYLTRHARANYTAVLKSPFMNFREKIVSSFPKTKLLEKSLETMATYDFRENLNFEVPVQFIFGEEETICPADLITECFERITAPLKEVAIITKASHGCFYDNPEAFNDALEKFLLSVKNKGFS